MDFSFLNVFFFRLICFFISVCLFPPSDYDNPWPVTSTNAAGGGAGEERKKERRIFPSSHNSSSSGIKSLIDTPYYAPPTTSPWAQNTSASSSSSAPLYNSTAVLHRSFSNPAGAGASGAATPPNLNRRSVATAYDYEKGRQHPPNLMRSRSWDSAKDSGHGGAGDRRSGSGSGVGDLKTRKKESSCTQS